MISTAKLLQVSSDPARGAALIGLHQVEDPVGRIRRVASPSWHGQKLSMCSSLIKHLRTHFSHILPYGGARNAALQQRNFREFWNMAAGDAKRIVHHRDLTVGDTFARRCHVTQGVRRQRFRRASPALAGTHSSIAVERQPLQSQRVIRQYLSALAAANFIAAEDIHRLWR